MKTIAATLLLALVIPAFAAGDAFALSRNGSTTGPRGTSTVSATANCANGSCNRNVNRTGPTGNTYSRTGTASCSGGHCTTNAVTTLPNGQTVTHQGSVSR